MVNVTTNKSQARSEDTKPSQLPLTQSSTVDTLTTDTSTTLGSGASALPSDSQQPNQQVPVPDADAKSDASFDPLFDDEPDADGEPDTSPPSSEMKPKLQSISMPGSGSSGPALHLPSTGPPVQTPQRPAPMPKNAPPLLDRVSCAA